MGRGVPGVTRRNRIVFAGTGLSNEVWGIWRFEVKQHFGRPWSVSLVKRGEALALLAPISNCEYRLKSPLLECLSLLEVIHRSYLLGPAPAERQKEELGCDH